MTPSDPNAPIIRRFNGYHGRSSIPIRTPWKLRTEKLIEGAWIVLARFPSVTAEHRHDQRERLDRHAVAFGGEVRLLSGEMLLATWVDGLVREDFREVA